MYVCNKERLTHTCIHTHMYIHTHVYRYLLKQLRLAKDRKNSVFEIICEQKTFRLRNGVSFHFFTSQVPCENKKSSYV